MSKRNSALIIAAMLVSAAAPQAALAQTQDSPALITLPVQAPAATTNHVKRDIEPIPYWVDASTLRVRDNPVAGRIVSSIDYGHKVLAYNQYENWVMVSKPGEKQKWVNSDFLSNSRILWANYGRQKPTRSSDIIAVRIKNPDDRKARVFGVRLKSAETGNALITTREDTSDGAFFQNRFVSCSDQRAVGSRLVGEGYSFLAAQNDVRGTELDIYNSETIKDEISGGLDSAVANFACKAQPF